MKDIIDREILQNIRDIAGDQADELLEELIQNYLEDAPQSLQRIREALSADDAAKLEAAAHALRSISLNLGAASLADVCQSLEFIGRAGNTDGADPLVIQAESIYEQVKEILRQDYLKSE
ncbi:MAG TPA: Hpt domain-containing protein [Crinalium sp.]|jgi:HPt (histidine-containing phosphotransfer) domain-containing protein